MCWCGFGGGGGGGRVGVTTDHCRWNPEFCFFFASQERGGSRENLRTLLLLRRSPVLADGVGFRWKDDGGPR